MERNGLESLLIRESVRKLYAHARKDYDMDANVPHWVRTLVHLFKVCFTFILTTIIFIMTWMQTFLIG